MKKILILLMILSVTTVQAQLVDNAIIENTQSTTSHNLKPAVTPFSLLDFSKITWSHSYSVSFFSGGNGSNSLGVWNTSMFYEVSSKLSLALNVGIAHDPGSIWGDANSSADILPGFMLDYHPSKNFNVQISMQSYRGTNNYYNPYYGNNLRNSYYR